MSCIALTMVSFPELLLAVVGTAPSVGLMLAIVALMQKLPSRPKLPCIACGSTDLAVVATGVYRCRTYGYEGGEHLGKLEPDEAARLAWEKRPWPERIAAARADLAEVQRRLTAMESDMEPVLITVRAFHALFVQLQALATKIADAAAKVPGLTVPVLPDVGLVTTQPTEADPA